MQNVGEGDTTPTARPMLTIREVAAELGVSEKTIRRWIKTGDLPAWRRGQVLRVSRTALDAFLREG